ncbi:MAG: hypothetical protein Q7S22_01670 [Candidatus Micrarchaeota archaeon]|nr:hypothetical protein [Candidatus Micrarchaeota archaeon]
MTTKKNDFGFITITDKDIIAKLKNVGAWVIEEEELKLPLLEAAYFAEKGVLKENFDELMKRLKKEDKLAEEKYAILKYLRNNGYITRVSLDTTEFFRVYQKGFRPGEDRTKYVLKVIPKDWHPKMDEIREALEFSGNIRKELVFAYLDQKKINFIKMARTSFD